MVVVNTGQDIVEDRCYEKAESGARIMRDDLAQGDLAQRCAVSARGHRSEPRAPSDTRPDRETTGPNAASPAM